MSKGGIKMDISVNDEDVVQVINKVLATVLSVWNRSKLDYFEARVVSPIDNDKTLGQVVASLDIFFPGGTVEADLLRSELEENPGGRWSLGVVRLFAPCEEGHLHLVAKAALDSIVSAHIDEDLLTSKKCPYKRG
jgi:hypothetical protein